MSSLEQTNKPEKNYFDSISNDVKDWRSKKINGSKDSAESQKALKQAQEAKKDFQGEAKKTKQEIQNTVYSDSSPKSQEKLGQKTDEKLEKLDNQNIPSSLNMLLVGSGLETRLGVETMQSIDQIMDMYITNTLGDVLQPRLRAQFRATMELVLMEKFRSANQDDTKSGDVAVNKPQSMFAGIFDKLNKIGGKASDLGNSIQSPLNSLQAGLKPLFEKLGVTSVVKDTVKIIGNLTTILKTAQKNGFIDKAGKLNQTKMPGASRDNSLFADSRKLSAYLISNPNFQEKTLESDMNLSTTFAPFFNAQGVSLDNLALAIQLNQSLKDADISTIQKSAKDGSALFQKVLITGKDLRKTGLGVVYDELKDTIKKVFPIGAVFLDFLFGAGSDNLIQEDEVVLASSTQELAQDSEHREKFEPTDEEDISDIHKGSQGYETIPKERIQAELDKIKGVPFDAKQVNNSAKRYNVPVSFLLAFMRNDSSYGTDGRRAIDNRNPGNVGNTDDGKNRRFDSWQEGIDACASNIRKRINAYQKICGKEVFPTMKELATGVVNQVNKKGEKFYGVYMTSKQGQNTVATIQQNIDSKLS